MISLYDKLRYFFCTNGYFFWKNRRKPYSTVRLSVFQIPANLSDIIPGKR